MRDDDFAPRRKKKRKKPKTLLEQPLFWILLVGGVLVLAGGVTAVLLLTRDKKYDVNANDPLLTGLVAHWSFDQVENNRVVDSSGNKNDGLLIGGELVPGKKGKAVAFSGLNQTYLDINGAAKNLSIGANTNFTAAAWFQTTERSGTILALRHSTLPCQFGLFVRDGRGIAVVGDDFDVANNNHAFKWIDAPNDGNWHHIAVQRTGPTVEVFYDGQSWGKDFTKNVSGPLTFDMCAVGLEPMFVKMNEFRFGRPGFKGMLDEVYLFHRALSQQELGLLMYR